LAAGVQADAVAAAVSADFVGVRIVALTLLTLTRWCKDPLYRCAYTARRGRVLAAQALARIGITATLYAGATAGHGELVVAAATVDKVAR
jgi:hypothetical protein